MYFRFLLWWGLVARLDWGAARILSRDSAPEEDDQFYQEHESNLDDFVHKFADQLFIPPNDSSGDLVSKWNSSWSSNPEELGGYVEGDILFPAQLVATARNGITSLSSRWSKGTVPYVLNGYFSSKDKSMIMRAMDEYHKYTCVKFVPRRNERDYIVLKTGNTGCWSSVGKVGGAQEVNLQNPGCLSLVGTVVHELMHALGFMHEQNRWERDGFVSIRYQNIQSGKEYNFEKAKRGGTDGQGVDYDYTSVMHYSETAFSKNGQPTIVPKSSGVKLGQRNGLSKKDMMKIRRMYKCKNKVSHVP